MTPMLTLLRTLSLGYFSQHRTRSVLVVLSIALGVATLVATQVLNKSLKAGVQQGVNPLAGLADLLIVNGETGVPASLAKELQAAKLDGVTGCTPFVLWRMTATDLDRKLNKVVWLLGVEWPKDHGKAKIPTNDNLLGVTIHPDTSLGWLEKLSLAAWPPALVSENLATLLKEARPKGRRFFLLNAGRTAEVTQVGTVTFSSSELPLKDSLVVVMDLHSASMICFPEKPGHIHQIGVTIEPGADVERVSASIREWLGGRADVQTIEASKQLVSDVTAGLEIGLAVGGAGALVVGLFLTFNALSVSVAERRHDIGILRSVGATRAQIAGMFIWESLLMGLTGSALGLPLGWVLARALTSPMASTVSDVLVPIDSVQLQTPAWLVAVSLLAGTLVAVLAALLPALHAAAEEPADAVRRVPRRRAVFDAALQIAGASALLLAGFALARYRHHLPERMGM
jgi:putative ABC transport system permease protein